MNEKRFTVKPQDDYFGVTDNITKDKVNVVNGIHTRIEAEWLCDLLNSLYEENQKLRNGFKMLEEENDNLNKFFLYNCKTREYIEWLKKRGKNE